MAEASKACVHGFRKLLNDHVQGGGEHARAIFSLESAAVEHVFHDARTRPCRYIVRGILPFRDGRIQRVRVRFDDHVDAFRAGSDREVVALFDVVHN